MSPKLSVVDTPDHELAERNLQEKALIEAAKKGDKTAFKCLYKLHVGRVYGLCLRLCADKSLAEDATQERV